MRYKKLQKEIFDSIIFLLSVPVQHVMEDKLLIPVVRCAKTSHIDERK